MIRDKLYTQEDIEENYERLHEAFESSIADLKKIIEDIFDSAEVVSSRANPDCSVDEFAEMHAISIYGLIKKRKKSKQSIFKRFLIDRINERIDCFIEDGE